ncbi:hypothetical protein [Natronorarus salvus]|uniref:hypothetical protein n=1 Tax=Natronorarus salvus TaxID=3117733 RepID=UPI002F2648D8
MAALVIATVVAFSASKRPIRSASYVLGLLSFMSIVMLPRIRGWYYQAESDALSHLGATREFAYGVNEITNSQYPFIHTVTVFLSGATGVELNRTFLIVVPAFVLTFIIFSVLTARLFSNDRWILGMALFSGMLLLPINHIQGRVEPQPSAQAILYVTLALFLLIFVMLEQDHRTSLLLILVSFSMVVLHPQHAASLILLFLGIAGAHLLYATFWRTELSTTGTVMPIYIHASLIVIFFWIWSQAIIAERFERNFSRMIGSMFIDTETAASVQTRGVSLEAIGGTIEEIFIKLFLISVIYCAICALLMGASVTTTFFTRFERLQSLVQPISFKSRATNLVFAFWTFGFFVTSALFFVYILGSLSDQYMRHYGFLMAMVTIMGALAVGQILKFLASRFSVDKTKPIAIIFIIICLSMTVPVIYGSPYIYQDSHHVPEQTLEGHSIALKIADEEALHTTMRRNLYRYQDAVLRGYDTDRSYEDDYRRENVPDHFANDESRADEIENQRDLHGFYGEYAYLYVKERDRIYETQVINGLRWSDEDLDYLEQEPGINRVQDNGGFNLYAIENRESSNE